MILQLVCSNFFVRSWIVKSYKVRYPRASTTHVPAIACPTLHTAYCSLVRDSRAKSPQVSLPYFPRYASSLTRSPTRFLVPTSQYARDYFYPTVHLPVTKHLFFPPTLNSVAPSDLRYNTDLCDEEKAFLEKRKVQVFEAMKNLLGERGPKHLSEVRFEDSSRKR